MSSSTPSCRHAMASALLAAASEDPSIYAVCSDSRGSAAMGDFATALPQQFVEVGIAEQDAIGVAAGLALCGKRVFVCGPASFYASRSLEQVKVDVAYAGTDVKVIGISGGVSYGSLGSTHHSLHDIAVMRTFPGLEVFLPCDAVATAAITRYLATSSHPAYMRIGRGPVPEVHSQDNPPAFVPGKAIMLREGRDCSIIAAGEALAPALRAADLLLERGIHARVLDAWSISPLDREAIAAAARETPCILTVEEHSIHGGLGSAVAEVVVQTQPRPMRILGFPDEWAPAGSSSELFRHYGLTPESIATEAIALYGRSGRI